MKSPPSVYVVGEWKFPHLDYQVMDPRHCQHGTPLCRHIQFIYRIMSLSRQPDFSTIFTCMICDRQAVLPCGRNFRAFLFGIGCWSSMPSRGICFSEIIDRFSRTMLFFLSIATPTFVVIPLILRCLRCELH